MGYVVDPGAPNVPEAAVVGRAVPLVPPLLLRALRFSSQIARRLREMLMAM